MWDTALPWGLPPPGRLSSRGARRSLCMDAPCTRSGRSHTRRCPREEPTHNSAQGVTASAVTAAPLHACAQRGGASQPWCLPAQRGRRGCRSHAGEVSRTSAAGQGGRLLLTALRRPRTCHCATWRGLMQAPGLHRLKPVTFPQAWPTHSEDVSSSVTMQVTCAPGARCDAAVADKFSPSTHSQRVLLVQALAHPSVLLRTGNPGRAGAAQGPTFLVSDRLVSYEGAQSKSSPAAVRASRPFLPGSLGASTGRLRLPSARVHCRMPPLREGPATQAVLGPLPGDQASPPAVCLRLPPTGQRRVQAHL